MAAGGRGLRVLVAMFQGGGNVPLIMPIVAELAKRGHQVHVVAGPGIRLSRLPVSPGFARRLSDSGASYEILEAPQPHPLDGMPALRGLLFGWAPENLRLVTAAEFPTTAWSTSWAREIEQRLEIDRPDVLMSDFFLWGAMAAGESSRVPVAVLVHNAFPHHGAGQLPKGCGFLPARTPWESLRQALWKRAYDRIWKRDGLPALNQARAQLGLRPMRSPFDQYALADRVLVLGSRAFDFASDRIPSNVRYVGTPIDDRDVVGRAWHGPWPADDRRPLVLVSLSTLP